MNEHDKKLDEQGHGPPSRVEEFLDAVERKTEDKIHRRILRACRQGDPTTCVEEELKRIIEEILHDET